MVYQYTDKGDRRQYLSKNFPTLVWEQKISILISIALDLLTIHHEGYLHKDLHSGNILLFSNTDQPGIKSCISDLGLSRKMDDTNANEQGVCGVLPYLAPEVLLHQPYTKESDIYSLGVIMSEMSIGKLPFENESHDICLLINICKNGL